MHTGTEGDIVDFHADIHTYRDEEDRIIYDIHTYIHAYIHSYIHADEEDRIIRELNLSRFDHYTYTHTHIHTYIHACIHTCMHTYIHTYMQMKKTGLYVS